MEAGIGIPAEPKSPKYRGLNETIKRAAARFGTNHFAAGLLISFWLEEVASAVSRGDVVVVPGFGAFCPYIFYTKKGKLGKRGEIRFTAPGFSPARGFRELTAQQCPPLQAVPGHEYMYRHRRNHHRSSGSTKSTSRPEKGLEAFRQELKKRMKEIGFDDFDLND